MPEPTDQPTPSATATTTSTTTFTGTEISIVLDEETIDDLIYYTRIADLSTLRETIQTLSNTHSTTTTNSTTTTTQTTLNSAIDPDTGSGLLHYASANGSVDVVEYLLSLSLPSSGDTGSREWINRANNAGNTALHWAGVNGHLDVVKLLVGGGADPGLRNEVGRDVLVESEVSSREGCAEVVKWLEREWRGLESGVVGGAGQGVVDGREGERVDEEQADRVEEVEIKMKMEGNGGGEEGGKNGDGSVNATGTVNGNLDTSKTENINGERG